MKSYGIILYTNINNQKHFLIYQRRDSNSFINLLRNYHKLLHNEIDNLFDKLTAEEKDRMSKYGFDELWSDLFVNKSCRLYKKEMEQARENFNNLKLDGYFEKHLSNGVSQQLEWGFPKGRIKKGESFEDCAVREFNEETSFDLQDMKFIGKYYNMRIHKRPACLYLCKTFKKYDIKRFTTNEIIRKEYISEETEDLKWITAKECDQYLNPYFCMLIRHIDRNFT